MNPTTFTTRPAMSTIVISANLQGNSRMLDELLATNKGENLALIPSMMKSSSRWFSQSSYLGLDDNKHLMYSLTRGETGLFITVAVAGLTALGSLLTWLVG